MPKNQLGTALNYLARIVGYGPDHADSDARLLARFIEERDEAAFEALVRRHGPLVLATCRRLLADANDVEDAFQATFFILVRRMKSIGQPERLAGWLHGVACRVAARARAARAKRLSKQTPIADVPAEATMDEALRQELWSVLDEEVARLPARYQAPFVLCYLAGHTNEETAQTLGCPNGTVFSRLARAREILRTRLARRGLTVSSAMLTATLSTTNAPAAVPGAMLDATIQGGLLLAAGRAAALGSKGIHVLTLVEETQRTMFLAKAKLLAIVLIILTAGAGISMVTHHATAARPTGNQVAEAADEPAGPREQELKQLRDKIANLEQKLAVLEKQEPPVTYQGKPAGYWLQRLRDRDPEFRISALAALEVIAEEDRSVIPAMIGMLKTRDQHVLDKAIEGLAKLGPDAAQALPELLKLVACSSVLENALLAIDPEGKVVVPAMLAKLKDANPNIRAAAARIAVVYGDKAKAAVPALIALIRDKDYSVYTEVGRAFEKMGPVAESAQPALLELLNDKDADVGSRRASLVGLYAVAKSEIVIPVLIKLVNDAKGNINLRFDAVTVLGKYGRQAKAAVPSLIEFIKGGEDKGDFARSVLDDIDHEAATALFGQNSFLRKK